MYLCTPPSEEYAIDLPSVCMFLCTLVCVSVCAQGPDSSEPLFLHAGAAPIGFVRGSYIWAVLEIHQPWQVYCSTTLHSPWPTTHTEISLSIRKTFVSGWRWIWKDCSRLKRGQTKIAGWKEHRVCLKQKQIFFCNPVWGNSLLHYFFLEKKKKSSLLFLWNWIIMAVKYGGDP